MTLKVKSFREIREMRQNGFGLLDVILASVLLLGALAGIIVLFNNANLSANVTETGRAAATMSSEVRGLYRTNSDFSGLTTDQVINSEIAPANLILDDGAGNLEIQTPFGGASRITIEEVAGTPTFEMSFTDLRAAACERLSVNPTGEAGPLGTSYEVSNLAGAGAADCAAEGGFVATFGR